MTMDNDRDVNKYIDMIQQILGDLTIYQGEAYIALGKSLVESGKKLIQRGERKIAKGQERKRKHSGISSERSKGKPEGNECPYSSVERDSLSRKNWEETHDEVLVLFVKADAGEDLLKKLSVTWQLSSEMSEDLYLNTMNIWMGSSINFHNQFTDAFNSAESKGATAALDFVMLKIDLKLQYGGLRKGKGNIERMNAIEKLCEDNARISQISKRLNFDVVPVSDFIWEK